MFLLCLSGLCFSYLELQELLSYLYVVSSLVSNLTDE